MDKAVKRDVMQQRGLELFREEDFFNYTAQFIGEDGELTDEGLDQVSGGALFGAILGGIIGAGQGALVAGVATGAVTALAMYDKGQSLQDIAIVAGAMGATAAVAGGIGGGSAGAFVGCLVPF